MKEKEIAKRDFFISPDLMEVAIDEMEEEERKTEAQEREAREEDRCNAVIAGTESQEKAKLARAIQMVQYQTNVVESQIS